MEHVGSLGPLPTEPEDLSQGWGWPCHQPGAGGRWRLFCPPRLLSQPSPLGPGAVQHSHKAGFPPGWGHSLRCHLSSRIGLFRTLSCERA